VLSEPGWCYVVTLSATGGMALAATHASALLGAATLASAAQRPVNGEHGTEGPPLHRDSAGGAKSGGASEATVDDTGLEDRLGALSLHRQQLTEAATQEELTAASLQSAVAQAAADAGGPLTAAGMQADLRTDQKLSQPFDDPLRRPASVQNRTSPSTQAASRGTGPLEGGAGVPKSAGASSSGDSSAGMGPSLRLFTGFVSHEQLEEVMGNRWERRAAAKRQATHWVKMKGPGAAPPALTSARFVCQESCDC
jgi:hypothetical protein